MKTLNPTEEELTKIKADIKARAVPVNLMKRGGVDLDEKLEAARSRSADRHRGKVKTGRKRESETHVLRACMDILEAHPKVALWWRQNSFALKDKRGVYVRSAFVGCADLLGMLKATGRLIAVETKATGKKPTDAQQAFLDNVARSGGLSMCVDDPQQLIEALNNI